MRMTSPDRQRNFTSTFMYDASGMVVDAISRLRPTAVAAADRLRVLEDTRGAFPSHDALVLISPKLAALDQRPVSPDATGWGNFGRGYA
jgi:hypothetical protein